jgi:hypothetical protein
MPSTDIVYEPISLGSACEAKFQICRNLYKNYYSRKSEAGLRIQMMPPERGQRAYGWHAFDWQRTPFSSMLAWLERDFNCVFEREDLSTEGAFVTHRQWDTEHSHQFETFQGDWREQDLDAAYPTARRRFDKRVEQFREILTKPGPYLYVWTASYYVGTDRLPPADEVRRLLTVLGAGSKDHQFHLLMVGNPGKDADYSGLEDKVSKALRIENADKAPAMTWEGNDARWAEILAPFRLTLHDREQPTASAMTPGIETPQAKPGLLGRLFGR